MNGIRSRKDVEEIVEVLKNAYFPVFEEMHISSFSVLPESQMLSCM
jgi:hypothetical protein